MAGRGKSMTKPAWLVQKEREEALAGGGGPPPPLFDQSPFQQQPPQHYQPQFPLPSPYQSGLPPPYQPGPPPTRHRTRSPRPPLPVHRGQYDEVLPHHRTAPSASDVRARRMFVSGTQGFREDELRLFFNQTVADMMHQEDRTFAGAVVSITVNDAKSFTFVEFAEAEMMHAVLDLQSLPFRGKSLRFQKPKDYELTRPLRPLLGGAQSPRDRHSQPRHHQPAPPPMSSSSPSYNIANNNNNKLSVDNVPLDMNEHQFSAIFASYGQLNSAQLFSGGRGMVDYVDPIAYERCYNELPKSSACYGMRLNRAAAAAPAGGMPLLPPPAPSAPMVIPTSVLLLLNMVTKQEVADPTEYREIIEDVEIEAKRFGQVRQVLIPREGPGVGRVFVAYHRAEDAVKAHHVMHNRKFSGRIVESRFYSERAFADRVYDM